MRRWLVLLASIAILTCIFCTQLFAQIDNQPKTDVPTVAWFVKDDSHGLQQLDDNVLTFGDTKIVVKPLLNKLYAAAYYPKENIILTVEPDATVRIYCKVDDAFYGESMKVNEFKAETTNVWITRMPSVYVECEEKTPKKTKHCLKVDMRNVAENIYAFTTTGLKDHFLSGCFTAISNEFVRVSLSDGKWVNINLPDPIRKPFNNISPLDQSIFVAPNERLVIITEKGLAVCKTNGKLLKWTAVENAGQCSWSNPQYKDNLFTVDAVSKDNKKTTYRIDIMTGYVFPTITDKK